MSIHHIPTVFGILVAAVALAAPAMAAPAENHIPEVPAVATPGIAAEAEAVLGAKLLVCNTCHGTDGKPRSAPTPIIWGQQEPFLLKQLNDFHSGERNSDVMTWMATALSPVEMAPTAAFFAKKNWPARAAGTPTTSPPTGVAVCQACHQENLVGGLAAPRLAGQTYEYLLESMRLYADGGRNNNPVMTAMMKAIPAAEREALARYISGL